MYSRVVSTAGKAKNKSFAATVASRMHYANTSFNLATNCSTSSTKQKLADEKSETWSTLTGVIVDHADTYNTFVTQS